ncbi:hypothetical protein SLEP1_g14809 [Rubroshorea leprosula]|uniref:CBS domain-containing protein n=1 Tax=Rubroshorea leprosula TaxID=152421 RepID=A0AAV5IKB3_9ROSI|nr:hypothetical protein SLEP1_g14809 [Rubroshorea leprosula]
MASVFLYHVVGDLTVGKPDFVEFYGTETVELAIQVIGDSTECGIPVWRKRQHVGMTENSEMRQQRFVGILTSLDIVAFLARSECLENQEKAMKTPVSEVVVPNNSLLKQVDPATRLIDALEMMKQGVKRLLVPKSKVWKGMSKRFSILYNGKWLKNIETGSNNNLPSNSNRPSSSSTNSAMCDKFCCLSREDIIRFLIGCLGALAPLPLSSIFSVGAINQHYNFIEASLPAIEVTRKPPGDPSAVAVVELTPNGQLLPDFPVNLSVQDDNVANGISSPRQMKFSSRSIGFNPGSSSFGIGRSMYRGRSAPLTCKITSSLAAVMAQMLSHRATHVWVTEDESDDVLVGVVGYADILFAVTKPPSMTTVNQSNEAMRIEVQN